MYFCPNYFCKIKFEFLISFQISRFWGCTGDLRSPRSTVLAAVSPKLPLSFQMPEQPQSTDQLPRSTEVSQYLLNSPQSQFRFHSHLKMTFWLSPMFSPCLPIPQLFTISLKKNFLGPTKEEEKGDKSFTSANCST